MLCLRCGQCCLHLDIFIVNPSSILADGSIDPDDHEAMIFKTAGERCPHLAIMLVGSGPLAVCTIHHLHCYRGTPCEQFEQLGPDDVVCVMSQYLEDLDKG
jgi:ferredoxin